MKRVCSFVACSVLAAVGLVVGTASIALAGDCTSGTSFSGNSASAGVACPNVSGNSPGSVPSGGASQQPVWNRYCAASAGGYTEGSHVEFEPGPMATLEDLQTYGYDETGVYQFHSIVCYSVDPDTGDVTETRPNFAGLLNFGVLFEITPPIDPTVLRDRAMASITVDDPLVGMSPPGTADHFSIVQEETWLWVENGWETLVAAEGQGFVTVEVQVRPTHITWDMGDVHARWNDGGLVTCTGPGTPYSDQALPRGTDCGYTYRTSTASQPDQTYKGSATVHWEASWSINGVDQGVFTTLTPSATFEQAVGEIQAVIVDEPCNC